MARWSRVWRGTSLQHYKCCNDFSPTILRLYVLKSAPFLNTFSHDSGLRSSKTRGCRDLYIYTIVLQMSTSQLNNSTTFLRCRVRRSFQRKRIFIIFTIFSETIFKITKLVTKLSWHRPWDTTVSNVFLGWFGDVRR